jgi:hypothetical protein
VENTQPLGVGEVLIVAVLLLIIAVAGRWDYDDALANERAVAEVNGRKLMCQEVADNTVHRRSHADQGTTRVAAYRVTGQAAEVVVLRCIVVAD